MNLKIETLTPIHIGTGKELQPQFDYLPFARSVAVLDEQKVLEIFAGGSRPTTADINRWVNMIDNREPLLPYLKPAGPHSSPPTSGAKFRLRIRRVSTKSSPFVSRCMNLTGVARYPALRSKAQFAPHYSPISLIAKTGRR